jgi:polygalacturonase
MSIGSETSGGVRRVKVERCTFRDTVSGIRIKSNRSVGGEVSFISYRDITMENVKNPIVLTGYYPESSIPPPFSEPPAPLTLTTPNYHHIRIHNVIATGTTSPAGKIVGVPELLMHDIVLKDILISAAPTGLWLRNASVTISNAQILPASGPPFVVQENATIQER